MYLKDLLYHVCIACVTVLQAYADSSLLNMAPLIMEASQQNMANDLPMNWNSLQSVPENYNHFAGPNMIVPKYKKQFMPPFSKHNKSGPIQKPPPLFMWPPSNVSGSLNNKLRPPKTPLGYIKIPQIPIRFIGFPQIPGSNKSMNVLPPMTPLRSYSKGFKTPLISSGSPAGGFAKMNPSYLGYFGTPQEPLPIHMPQGGGDDTHVVAAGVVIQGPTVSPQKGAIDTVDQRHHLPMNHLFVPLPVDNGDNGEMIGPKPKYAHSNVADILIVIDASKSMGHIDQNGLVVWSSGVVDFLNKFVTVTPMGPKENRIGVVVVSIGIDDMIPLTHNKQFLIKSLNNLRPSFRGGCTQKGISTASNLFYQYGRPYAVKRIVLLSEGSIKCPYGNMAEILYARKCGIDIVHVGFGKLIQPPPQKGEEFQSNWLVPSIDTLPSVAGIVANRAFIQSIIRSGHGVRTGHGVRGYYGLCVGEPCPQGQCIRRGRRNVM